jgi:hypothetical protein
MHWSARHATRFTRISFLVAIIVLWYALTQAQTAMLMGGFPMNLDGLGFNGRMIAGILVLAMAILSMTSILSLIRSARIQQEEGLPLSHIKHSVGSDFILPVIILCLSVTIGLGIKGASADAQFTAGITTAVVLGIATTFALHKAAQPRGPEA